MPPPNVETYSRFALLIRELSWALDVIHYASSSKDLEFGWSEEKCRLVVVRSNDSTDLSVNALEVAEVESLATGVDDQLVQDRKKLLFQLKSGEIFTQENVSSPYAAEKLNLPDDFGTVLKNRLQEIADLHSPGSVPTCFQINHLQLHLERCISRGSFKEIYQGEWFGQRVAIAKIKRTTRDIVEKEAGFMVKVQHPNIVDFFGCAIEEREKEESVSGGKRKQDYLAEDKKKEGSSPEESRVVLDVHKRKEQEASRPPEVRDMELVGYLVMELMQEDLRSLINREAKNHSGAPFSLSVSVDILLQIVEAMLHLQKHNVIYRDLKANNCLVSRRPKVNLADLDGYTIKLIDFGTSKVLESEDDETSTIDVGSRRWMAPEIWGIKQGKPSVNSRHGFLYPLCFFPKEATVKKQDRPSKAYTRSADVYSFAMTCYEITTGLLPFHDVKNSDIPNMIYRERRPLFSHPAAFSCPLLLQTLMTQCWAQDPKDRPQFEDVRKELWNIKYNIEVQR
ncbi:hypothetical protein KC19_5G143100 [Ceratodon purpureus]|uniref:Protein kinase domain-containing protein n=1 Tax=Ceratodon purpureus TaxID=3225 RepID=A0A8T0I1F6_CERPU|nr:hypothetical protein KC19_5G143100 [Ceratodon purpureus]